MKALRYGSVCSGIEAATTAWHPLGWEPVFFSEIESFPSAVLSHRHPKTPNLGDMTKFKDWPEYAIDLLVGGTPCQSFSVAGLRKGLADPRGNLMLTYLAIAARYRPKWLVWENVPGVLSSNGGKDFGTLLGGLGELGYGFAYRVLDAQYVRVESHARAVPQRRRRVFVVGYFGDWRRAAAVLFERESLCGNTPPRRESGKGITHPFAPCLTGSGRGTERTGDTRGQDAVVAVQCGPIVPQAMSSKWSKGSSGPAGDEVANLVATVAPAVTSNPYGDHESREGLLVAQSLRAEGFDASEDGTGRGTPLVPMTFIADDFKEGTFEESNTARPLTTSADRSRSAPIVAFSCKDHGADAGEISPTLRGMGHDGSHANGGGQIAVAFQTRIARNGRGQPEEICPALSGSDAGETSDMRPCVATRTAVRRLTPRECERLQGFPDDYTLIPMRGKPACDGPRYKVLGNSMAVNVMSWVGCRIQQVEELCQGL